jgi:hypothetical protein
MLATGGTLRRPGGWVFAVIGLILLVVALRNAVETYNFIRTAMRVEGKVVGLNAGGSHPQVSFIAGQAGSVSYPQGGLIFGFRPGDTVQVLFSMENPAGTATIDAVGALWFAALLPGGIGTAFLVLALALLRAN